MGPARQRTQAVACTSDVPATLCPLHLSHAANHGYVLEVLLWANVLDVFAPGLEEAKRLKLLKRRR